MTLKKLGSYAISVSLASAIVFAYGKHPTVDALLVTATWILIGFAGLAVAALTFVTLAIRKSDFRDSRDLGKFYKAIADMHSHVVERLISLAIAVYWLYAFILHEWTATAVLYLIFVIWMQLFIFFTKDLAKDFFLAQLKGEGLPK